ncbi:MAG: hypothetical protein SF066_17855 [Thermoanaerobaculia bacterium]|nr:hypothetical protein [Thermoanaerobaculia bacterium]
MKSPRVYTDQLKRLPRLGANGAELLIHVRNSQFLPSESTLDEIEALDTNDRPPEDKWQVDSVPGLEVVSYRNL